MMEVITKKNKGNVIKFSDLKYGDVFAHDENETEEEAIYIKIDNKGNNHNALCVEDFATYHTFENSDCYLIKATLTLDNE